MRESSDEPFRRKCRSILALPPAGLQSDPSDEHPRPANADRRHQGHLSSRFIASSGPLAGNEAHKHWLAESSRSAGCRRHLHTMPSLATAARTEPRSTSVMKRPRPIADTVNIRFLSDESEKARLAARHVPRTERVPVADAEGCGSAIALVPDCPLARSCGERHRPRARER